MAELKELTEKLRGRGELTAAEVSVAADALTNGEVALADKEAFLSALAQKRETAAEVASFAAEFRRKAVDPGVEAWSAEAIDIVGTGGDHAGGFNVSSVVVLILASAGVKVMKHGNRGITSRCGSADLMAGFGVDLEAAPERQQAALDQLGFAFFFAPAYHPAFRHIGPVRKALAAKGQRSIFNILGPLLNPGRPAHMLLGVYAPEWLPAMAAASATLGARAGVAVHGLIEPGKGIDELTSATVNRVRGIGRLNLLEADWSPGDVGLKKAPFSDLLGGDLAGNLATTELLVAGRGPKGLEDTLAWNAAVGLWILGKVGTPAEGIGTARELLVGGAVRRKLMAIREFYGKK